MLDRSDGSVRRCCTLFGCWLRYVNAVNCASSLTIGIGQRCSRLRFRLTVASSRLCDAVAGAGASRTDESAAAAAASHVFAVITPAADADADVDATGASPHTYNAATSTSAQAFKKRKK